MKVLNSIREILNIENPAPPIGLTIGNFDGVHQGHRKLLNKIKSDCEIKKLKFVVLTFVPHPQKILHPEKDRFLITSYEQRRHLLENLGVDYLVELKFTRDFSTLAPDEFIKNYLLIYPNLKNFYLGYDFAFGANKGGGLDQARNLCEPKGIKVEIQPKYEKAGIVVSSSYIRSKLLSGRIDEIEQILQRPFHLEGVVVKGEGRGRKIGFPTANIQVSSDMIIPQKGVYVTKAIYKGMTYHSVTNIGVNPTFNESENLHIETHLFDFNNDIYGEVLDIQFLLKIRDEKKFNTVNDLVKQIKHDVDHAKSYLERS